MRQFHFQISMAIMMGVVAAGHAFCPVGPDGINQWRLVAQVGDCVNTLGECLVGTAITQDLVPFTISVPGNYFLCESVTTVGAPAITIAANDVNLNLNGHTITNTDDRGIQCTGQSNIVIKNGVIKPFLEAIFIDTCSNVELVGIRTINTASVAIGIESVTELIIDSCVCTGYNGLVVPSPGQGIDFPLIGAAISVFESGCARIINCLAYDVGFLAGFFVGNIPNLEVEVINCASSGAFPPFCFYQDTYTAQILTVRGCVAGSTIRKGFEVLSPDTTFKGAVLENCVARTQFVGAEGYIVFGTNGTTLRNCVADACGGGGGFAFASDLNTLCKGCTANSNDGGDGFITSNVVPGTTNLALDDCVAIGNNAGFRMAPPTVNATLTRCIATHNTVGIQNELGATGTYLVDCRSSNSAATALNPAYTLNTGFDVLNGAVVILTS